MRGSGSHHGRAFARALLIVVAALGVGEGRAQTSGAALEFELEDQFGRRHRAAELRGRVVVLIGADREGSAHSGAWSRALREGLGALAEDVSVIGLADLSGVPFFMKAVVRKRFSERPDEWSLLDWEGELSRRYAFAEKSCNVLVFDRSGMLSGRANGGVPVQESVERLVTLVESLLVAKGRDR